MPSRHRWSMEIGTHRHRHPSAARPFTHKNVASISVSHRPWPLAVASPTPAGTAILYGPGQGCLSLSSLHVRRRLPRAYIDSTYWCMGCRTFPACSTYVLSYVRLQSSQGKETKFAEKERAHRVRSGGSQGVATAYRRVTYRPVERNSRRTNVGVHLFSPRCTGPARRICMHACRLLSGCVKYPSCQSS